MRSGSGEPLSMESPREGLALVADATIGLGGDVGADGELGVIDRPLIGGGAVGQEVLGDGARTTGALIPSFARARVAGNFSRKACASSRLVSIATWRVACHSTDVLGSLDICESKGVLARGVPSCGVRGGGEAGGAE
jgi:hypothetical protein